MHFVTALGVAAACCLVVYFADRVTTRVDKKGREHHLLTPSGRRAPWWNWPLAFLVILGAVYWGLHITPV